MRIELPISKSIANRLLILQAIHGDGLMTVSADMPDDVRLMSEAIRLLGERREARINLGNCGTAMRFLTAYCAQLEDQMTILDGIERMHHRPIGQLVDALREIGADIEYLGEEGFPPLRIKGKALDKSKPITLNTPQSTQFVSALLLIGANVQTDSTTPYITLTRKMIEQYALTSFTEDSATSVRRSGGNKISSVENKINLDFVSEANRSPLFLESDWSSAAFWYEHVALHGGEIHLPGLFQHSLQGDKIVADIFANLGVQTQYTTTGVVITKTIHYISPSRSQGVDCERNVVDVVVKNHTPSDMIIDGTFHQDFSSCPDLYPAVALTCEKLGILLEATGVDSLPLKESDRLRAVREHLTDHDHRMAMALLVAGYPVDDTDCIAKSYPQFLEQWQALYHAKLSIVIPRKGINDEGKGKKHALYRLISEAPTEYVWMMDDDVLPPSIISEYNERSTAQRSTVSIANDLQHSDLLILPLRMESENEHPSLLERLQIAEYAAIQQLTIDAAQKGKAVMCSGANLIVRRDRWLESYPDLHPEIPSGDDMFLLESFKRRGLNVAVLDDPQFEAIVRPHTSWRAFLRQRMRWAGKAPKYTDKDILRCGAMVVLANFLQLLCPLVLLVKFPIEYRLIKKRDASVSLFTALVLGICYPLYLFVSLIGGLFRRQW